MTTARPGVRPYVRAAAADGAWGNKGGFRDHGDAPPHNTDATSTAEAPGARGLGVALIAILSIGQIIGWGTTFYLPAVLGDEMGRELGVTRDTGFLGVTVMVTVGALLLSTCGKLMDRHGAGPFLPLGSLLIGAGLLQVAALPTLASALLAVTLFGLATPISLSLAGVTLLPSSPVRTRGATSPS